MTPAEKERVTKAAQIMSASHAEVLQAVKTACQVIDTLGRLSSMMRDTVTVNLFQLPQFLQAKEAIVTALADHPEARLDALWQARTFFSICGPVMMRRGGGS